MLYVGIAHVHYIWDVSCLTYIFLYQMTSFATQCMIGDLIHRDTSTSLFTGLFIVARMSDHFIFLDRTP